MILIRGPGRAESKPVFIKLLLLRLLALTSFISLLVFFIRSFYLHRHNPANLSFPVAITAGVIQLAVATSSVGLGLPGFLLTYLQSHPPTTSPAIKKTNKLLGILRGCIFTCVGLQFWAVVHIPPKPTSGSVFIILILTIQSYICSEMFTAFGMAINALVVPDLGYFKFGITMALASEVLLRGVGTSSFWVVFAVCVTLALLHENYWQPADEEVLRNSDPAGHSDV